MAACIRDQNVESAELAHYGCNSRLHFVTRRRIRRKREGADPPSQLGDEVLATPKHCDPRSFARKSLGARGTDSCAAAGDQHNLPVQAHEPPPRIRTRAPTGKLVTAPNSKSS